MDEPWLIVGLGNPGSRYAGNRHNVGAMVADRLADQVRATFRTHRTRALVAEGRLGTLRSGMPGPRVVIAKPTTYMNVSGGPVAGLANYYAIPPQRVLVVHDELDLPFDTLRLKLGGGEGGHNGLRDISKALDTRDYVRLRVGVGRPPGRMDPADFVLRDFGPTERKALEVILVEAADAVVDVVSEGLTAAQQRLHSPS